MFSALTILVFLMLAALVGLLSIKRIPEGQVYTLRRLGKPAGTLTAGTHLVVPLVERIAHKISITGYTLAVDERMDPESVATPTLRGRVWWQVLDPERADAVIDRADDLIRGRLREAVSRADGPADQDLRSRNQRIKQALNGTLRDRGVLVTRVELDLAA
ncbi:MAG TPA: SPFH domain-containing protein [Gammaproteobacteria bacterium]|jgi:regulator of protease activity HflC (stomatin/prohibitin superfamily)|nr:SPFH domain-containing protein [Gammaproteobacteria bacterium]